MGRLGDWLRSGALAVTLTLGACPASAQDSIWQRLSAGMRIVDSEHPETVMWARHYAQDPAAFARMLERSEPFLWFIVEAVELRDMPLEIALLPAVESAFNAKARSRASAQGLWQFIPDTGRAMGLHQAAHYDARSDAIASTRAALTYLQELHHTFGDWLLAVGAYNVGRGAMTRALTASDNRHFWDLKLPRETREHVPRLLGVALLIQQPARFGVTLPTIDNRQSGQLVALPRAVDLVAVARHAEVSIDTISRYNPGMTFLGSTQGKRQLLLPPQDAVRIESALGQHRFRPQPVPVASRYTVVAGDSLWRIARHHGVSVSQLCLWNDLQPKAVLKPGKVLRIHST